MCLKWGVCDLGSTIGGSSMGIGGRDFSAMMGMGYSFGGRGGGGFHNDSIFLAMVVVGFDQIRQLFIVCK